MKSLRRPWILMTALLTAGLLAPTPLAAEAAPPTVVLEEVVTDPQQDWDQSGKLTSSDEYVVLRNAGGTTVDLAGWRLIMEDSTPEEELLGGTLAPGEATILVNPKGLLNNDVRLRIVDADGMVVDEAALDGVAAPDGDAAGLLDEAVHLFGPWAGTKGPATGGDGLGASWAEAVWPTNGAVPGEPFQTVWLSGATSNLTLRLHVAPQTLPPSDLTVGAETAPLVQQGDGTWTAGPFTATGSEAAVSIQGDDAQVDAWPNGTTLWFPVDPDPPRLDGEPFAVVNETRHLHWVPSFIDDHSGIASTALYQETDGVRQPIPECALPGEGATGADCPLSDNVTRLFATATDQAGQGQEVLLDVVADGTPPGMPSSFVFEEQVPPRFAWPRFAESLLALAVDVADDVGGTWNQTRVFLAADALAFTDQDWAPGTPRAYRLVATDRGGNQNVTPWVALPPEAVPVQVFPGDLDRAFEHLRDNGTAATVLHFDRPLAEVPRLILQSDAPAAFRVVAEGTAAPDRRSAHYVLVPDGAVPETGQGAWRVTGGEGEDGAPVDPMNAPARWDHAPPRIEAAGWRDGWIAGSRHAIVVSAHDLGDPRPTLEVAGSQRVVVRQDAHFAELAVTGEGAHAFTAVARDATGNTAEAAYAVQLDGTPPQVRLVAAPERWTPEDPLVVTIHDNISGIVPETLSVEVRNGAEKVTPQISWNGSRVSMSPPRDLRGPFEVHVRVQDLAGNEATGLLGERVGQAPMRMTVTVNTTRDTTNGDPSENTTTTESGGHFAPTSGEPVRSWSDQTGLPPADDATMRESSDDSSGLTSQILTAFIGAGLLGLGTVVHRRRRAGKADARSSAKTDLAGTGAATRPPS